MSPCVLILSAIVYLLPLKYRQQFLSPSEQLHLLLVPTPIALSFQMIHLTPPTTPLITPPTTPHITPPTIPHTMVGRDTSVHNGVHSCTCTCMFPSPVTLPPTSLFTGVVCSSDEEMTSSQAPDNDRALKKQRATRPARVQRSPRHPGWDLGRA